MASTHSLRGLQVAAATSIAQNNFPDDRLNSPSLDNLPIELILEICRNLQSPTLVLALHNTNRALRNIIDCNVQAICEAIESVGLLHAPKVQAFLSCSDNLLATIDPKQRFLNSQQPHSRIVRLIYAMRCVRAMVDHWNHECDYFHWRANVVLGDPAPQLCATRNELSRFEGAIYDLFTISTIIRSPWIKKENLSKQPLTPMTTRKLVVAEDLDTGGEVAVFLNGLSIYDLARVDQMALRVLQKQNVHNTGSESMVLIASCQAVRAYCDQRESLHRKIFVCVAEDPLGYWPFFDKTQYYLDTCHDYILSQG